MTNGSAAEPATTTARTTLPAAGNLSASLVANWLAFGLLHEGDISGTSEFRRTWFYRDDGIGWPHDGRHPFLVAIEALETGATEWPVRPEDSPFLTRTRQGVFARAQERQIEWSVSPSQMADVLLFQMQNCQSRRAAAAAARRQILEALEHGKLSALGTPVLDGTASAGGSVPIPEYFFASPGVWLDAADTLGTTYGTSYVGVRMRAADVATAFATTVLHPTTLMRSGVAGRPTSKAAVEQEMRRRFASGEAEESLAAEARLLSAWLQQAHPQDTQMTSKSVEESMRSLFRELKAAPRKSST